MNIPVKHGQRQWLEQQVADGRFASPEEAIEVAIANLQAGELIDDHWARSLVAEAISALDRGEGTPWVKGEALAKMKSARGS
jgi:Arc/MetJ-type ribon-helix-helix transcriptional regulator